MSNITFFPSTVAKQKPSLKQPVLTALNVPEKVCALSFTGLVGLGLVGGWGTCEVLVAIGVLMPGIVTMSFPSIIGIVWISFFMYSVAPAPIIVITKIINHELRVGIKIIIF